MDRGVCVIYELIIEVLINRKVVDPLLLRIPWYFRVVFQCYNRYGINSRTYKKTSVNHQLVTVGDLNSLQQG